MKHLKLQMKLTVLAVLSLISFVQCQNIRQGELTDNGAWCWFSDPRAIYVGGKVITGWVKNDGTIEAAQLDIANRTMKYSTLYPQLEMDDHDNPAFTTTKNGDVLAMYTMHGGSRFLFHNTLKANGAFDFGEPIKYSPHDSLELKKYPYAGVCYANPYRLSAEKDRLFCFGRWTGYKPNIMWSDDNGENWSTSKVMISVKPFQNNNRPYVKYFSDGQSRIYMTFTDGHPRNEPTNSVYCAYYEKGAFYRLDGSKIADMHHLPFEPKQATLVYHATAEKGRAWIADIMADEKGYPVILYTRHPEETDHRYHYARYNGTDWLDIELCKAGKWFPQTPQGKKEPEPHYFGNMTIHPDNPDVVYLSRTINDVFEIERWETNDGGKTWKQEAVTENSQYDNVRPYIPRGLSAKDEEIVLWMENEKYVHYMAHFKVKIKYQIRN